MDGENRSIAVVEQSISHVDSKGLIYLDEEQTPIKAGGATREELLEKLKRHDPAIIDVKSMPPPTPASDGVARPLVMASPAPSDQLDAMRKRLEEQGKVIAQLQAQLGDSKKQMDAARLQVQKQPFGNRSSPNQRATQFLTPPQAPTGDIQPGETLSVEVVSLPDGNKLLSGQLTVEPQGTIALGAQWGRAKIAGQSVETAERQVQQKFEEGLARTHAMAADADTKNRYESVSGVRVQITRVRPARSFRAFPSR